MDKVLNAGKRVHLQHTDLSRGPSPRHQRCRGGSRWRRRQRGRCGGGGGVACMECMVRGAEGGQIMCAGQPGWLDQEAGAHVHSAAGPPLPAQSWSPPIFAAASCLRGIWLRVPDPIPRPSHALRSHGMQQLACLSPRRVSSGGIGGLRQPHPPTAEALDGSWACSGVQPLPSPAHSPARPHLTRRQRRRGRPTPRSTSVQCSHCKRSIKRLPGLSDSLETGRC